MNTDIDKEKNNITHKILNTMLIIYAIASAIILYQIAIDWKELDSLGDLQKDLIKIFVTYSAFIIIALIIKEYNLENIFMKFIGNSGSDIENGDITKKDNKKFVTEIKQEIIDILNKDNKIPILNTDKVMQNIKKEVLDIFSDDDIIAALQRKNSKLDKISMSKLQNMLLKLENKLLKNNNNKFYKEKLTNLINNKIIPMGSGTSNEDVLNTYFNYYNEKIICKKSDDKKFIICKVIIDYELINNSEEKISQTIFTKKSLDPSTSSYGSEILKLTSFSMTIDDKKQNHNFDEKNLNNIFQADKLDTESTSASTVVPIRMQIKEKIIKDGEEILVEFKREFNKSIIVEKELEVIIPYDDIFYCHIFHRPILNYTFNFRDENAIKVDAFLNSAFHKKTDDKILVKSTEINEINVSVKDDLVLPNEAVNVISIRN